MTLFLANKRILLGVTGSIAAYKSADLVRRLREAGAVVRVVMTTNAKQFITPLTMQAVSGHAVHESLFDLQAEAAMGHIELARWAEAVVVAPASADFIARLACGSADDLLTTLCLATKAPIMLAPAMNQGMWQHQHTQANVQVLNHKGIHLLETAAGSQACGEIGPGRMLEPIEIVKKVSELFATGALAGIPVMITAGPTQEPIDPVRYLTNLSSGKMGYALALAAYEAGALVTLISGPVALAKIEAISTVNVRTADEMLAAVMKNISHCAIFIAVAAVSDYRAQVVAAQKIRKNDETLTLHLTRTPDIVASVSALSPKPFIVGFAAETEEVLASARAKRQRKKMDMMVANRVGEHLGMGQDENEVTLITQDSEIHLPMMQKEVLARQLIDMIAKAFNKKRETHD